ncbi:MAG TPA: pyridoxal phosphate-dependent aminotransferase family protein [Candidatus Acidoferrum sp.]|nr:pyridoxal phosphate-dependent aminotransferase family protein [Candidatus Acidoferrum sp.]
MTFAPDDYDYLNDTMDLYLHGKDAGFSEVEGFNRWMSHAKQADHYVFELARSPRLAGGTQPGLLHYNDCIDFSSYDYLGMAKHPAVIEAANKAQHDYGLGATGSPILSGTLKLHLELQQAILDYFDRPALGVSLFTTGYNVSLGLIPCFYDKRDIIYLDQAAHMSIRDGALLSGAKVVNFKHNDLANLQHKLERQRRLFRRALICTEGIFSVDGDAGDIAGISALARQHDAQLLVDEAHSALIGGPGGRGIAAAQGVLEQVDFFVFTFSKALGGLGGAVITTKDKANYINWYARCRMFSCALPPGVTGGMIQALRLSQSSVGDERRAQLHQHVATLGAIIGGRIDTNNSKSWIVPLIFRDEKFSLPICKAFIDRRCMTSNIQFPAVPKGQARTRLFLSALHTTEQVERLGQACLEIFTQFDRLLDCRPHTHETKVASS